MTGSYVYLIISQSGKSYVGSSVDVGRRLRQHNGEITGGARYTSKDEGWQLACWVSGFPSWSAALQFEWRWKDITRKMGFSMKPLVRRIKALKTLLELEKSTSSAVPFGEWASPPEIHWEMPEAEELWNKENGL